MNKKIILFFVLSFLCFAVSAQFKHKSEELTYSIVSNAPEKADNLSFYFTPVYIELYKPNSDFNFGYGTGLAYRLPSDAVSVEAHYRSAYLDRLDEDANANSLSGKPAHGTKPCSSWGGTVTYNFFNEEIEKKYDVTVKTTSRVTYYTLIPAQAKKLYGVRLGADYYTGEYKFDRGIKGTIADRDTAASKNYTSDSQGFFTMMKTITTNIGISRSFIYDLATLMNFRDQKNMKREVHYISTFYADFVFAPSISFDNIYVPLSYDGSGGGYGWYNYHLVDISSTKKQTMGFKIGVQQYSTKKFGRTFGLELGSRPGIAGASFGDNLYMNIKFAFSFSGALGK